jgi:bifunctional aspartokinase / homoserine dehydrogenase 1
VAREEVWGLAAARKGLILAGLRGYRGGAPAPHDLVPAALKKVTIDEFFRRLPAFDQEWADRVAKEREQGHVLRYVVTATPRAVSAKLASVPVSSPMGALEGTRNLIAFTTRRYRREPLVVSGPGAGPAVTAAGILNDIYSLAAR